MIYICCIVGLTIYVPYIWFAGSHLVVDNHWLVDSQVKGLNTITTSCCSSIIDIFTTCGVNSTMPLVWVTSCNSISLFLRLVDSQIQYEVTTVSQLECLLGRFSVGIWCTIHYNRIRITSGFCQSLTLCHYQVECMSSLATIDSRSIGVSSLYRILITSPLKLITLADNCGNNSILYIGNSQIECISQGTTLRCCIMMLIYICLTIYLTVYRPYISTARRYNFCWQYLWMVDGQVQYILATASQWVGIYTCCCLGEGLTINSISITIASGHVMGFTSYSQVESVLNRTTISVFTRYCNMCLTSISLIILWPCICLTLADNYVKHWILRICTRIVWSAAVFNYQVIIHCYKATTLIFYLYIVVITSYSVGHTT